MMSWWSLKSPCFPVAGISYEHAYSKDYLRQREAQPAALELIGDEEED